MKKALKEKGLSAEAFLQKCTDAILAHEAWLKSHDWNCAGNPPEIVSDKALIQLARTIRKERKTRNAECAEEKRKRHSV